MFILIINVENRYVHLKKKKKDYISKIKNRIFYSKHPDFFLYTAVLKLTIMNAF